MNCDPASLASGASFPEGPLEGPLELLPIVLAAIDRAMAQGGHAGAKGLAGAAVRVVDAALSAIHATSQRH